MRPCSTGDSVSGLRLRRWQLARFADGLEALPIVRAIAKRLILGVPAAAEADGSPACQSELIAGRVENGEFGRIVGLKPERSIVKNGYLDSHAADVSRWETAACSATPIAALAAGPQSSAAPLKAS